MRRDEKSVALDEAAGATDRFSMLRTTPLATRWYLYFLISFDLLLLFVVLDRIVSSDHLPRCLVYAARLTQDDTNRSKKKRSV